MEMVKGYEIVEERDNENFWHRQFWDSIKHDEVLDFADMNLFQDGAEYQDQVERVMDKCIFEGVKTDLFNTSGIMAYTNLR